MIELNSWYQYECESVPDFEIYDIAIVGKGNEDDRISWTHDHLSKIAKKIITVSFSYDRLEIDLDDLNHSLDDFMKINIQANSVVVDSTSLALPELIHIFGMLNHNLINFDTIYVQPKTYAANPQESLHQPLTFNLSEDGLGIRQVPPFIGVAGDSRVFIFLGWEGHRLGSLINMDELNSNNVSLHFGIPPFETGWENITLANNVEHFDRVNRSSTLYEFSGANDPVETYKLLSKVHEAELAEKKSLCIAPFGTKPGAVATAYYATNNPKVIIYYDFVKNTTKRCTGSDIFHIWKFKVY